MNMSDKVNDVISRIRKVYKISRKIADVIVKNARILDEMRTLELFQVT